MNPKLLTTRQSIAPRRILFILLACMATMWLSTAVGCASFGRSNPSENKASQGPATVQGWLNQPRPGFPDRD